MLGAGSLLSVPFVFPSSVLYPSTFGWPEMLSRLRADLGVAEIFPEWFGVMFLGWTTAVPLTFLPPGTVPAGAVPAATVPDRAGSSIAGPRRASPRAAGAVLPESVLAEDAAPDASPVPRAGARPRRADAYLPAAMFLKRRIRAPRAARGKLAQIAALDLVRRTPFEARDVHNVLSRPRPAGDAVGADQRVGDQWVADQWVITREDLERIRARLRRQGYLLRRVHVAGETGLRPVASFEAESSRRARWWPRLNLVLLGTAIGLHVGALSWSSWQAARTVDTVRAETEQLRGEAVGMRTALDHDRLADQDRTASLALFLAPRLSLGLRELSVALPDTAWAHDRAALWNAVEAAETRKNSQVAREIRVALPAELDHGQRAQLVRDFCQRQFVDRSMVADIALHAPGREGDDRNYHAHILLTTREIAAEGFTTKNRDWKGRRGSGGVARGVGAGCQPCPGAGRPR